MITPSFSPTATERVLPRLALDFTTASLDARVTFTRTGNTATVINSSGNIVGINANLPRFDYNPTTLVCNGLLIEEARTNVLVNSLIDGTNLTTQIVTTTAVAYTLSFYGTGSIVLSGTSSSTQTGSGAYPSRKTYTFTPTAGALTLTVSGTVQYAQLEVGAFPTSYIPTTILPVLRNADVAVMTSTNFSSWYNASEGAFLCQAIPYVVQPSSAFPQMLDISNASKTNSTGIYNYQTAYHATTNVSGSGMNSSIASSVIANQVQKICYAFSNGSGASAYNGTLGPINSTLPLPTGLDRLAIGRTTDGYNNFGGWIQKLQYWPQRLSNAEVQAFSKI